MRYRAIIWDFDGTLADTLGCLLGIYNELAGRRGFRPIEDPETVRDLSLVPLLRMLRIPLRRLPGLVRDVLAAQKGAMAAIRLFPDLLPVLGLLRQQGPHMGVLSSNSRENILACLRANGAADLFDAVVGYRRVLGKGKALRRYLRAQNLAAADVVYVGDEVRDIKAAREAGVAVAAVTWGLNTPGLLARHHPDHLIERPQQLLEVF